MAAAVTTERRHQAVELVGPAGAGKSTLARLLCRQHPSFRPALTAWDLSPWLLATHGLRELPALARSGPHALHFRCFTDLTRIVALCTRLQYEDMRGYEVVLLDEGPVFLLTRVLAYQAEALQSAVVRERWLEALQICARTIDQVIWVDAPDQLLAERIRTRAKPHQVKGGSDAEISEFSASYRAAFIEVTTLLTEHGGPRTTCVTGREPLPSIAANVMRALQVSHVD